MCKLGEKNRVFVHFSVLSETSGSHTMARVPLVGRSGTAGGAQEEMQKDLYWERHVLHKFKVHGHK